MKRMNLRNTLSAALLMGGPILATSALTQSQGGHGSGSGMMGGYGASWMGGGYGGILIPALLIVVIAGLTFALPTYAETQGGTDAMGMGEKGATDVQQMSGMMHDMSGEMMEMSGMMDKGDMNPDAMKKMSSQMKQMGGMMENMSGMMGKGGMMDADQHKQMDQMHKSMDQMRKDMPAAPAKK